MMQFQIPSWLNKNEYPFNHHFFSAEEGNIHYIDEGKGETILFLHGTPSWSFDFRHAIKQLSHSYRCIAIDLLGFGLSDKPQYAKYDIASHTSRLLKFVEELKLDPKYIVMHDFGSQIGLSYLSLNLKNVKGILVLNSWAENLENHLEFKKIKAVLKSPLLNFMYLYLNISPKYLLPKSIYHFNKIKQIHSQYLGPFQHKNNRYALLAFAKSLRDDNCLFGSWSKIFSSKTHIKMVTIWGMKDPFVKPKFRESWEKMFPINMRFESEYSGHFPQEEDRNIPWKELVLFCS